MKQKPKGIEFSKILVAIDGSETSMRADGICHKSLKETKPSRRTRKNWSTIIWINSNRFKQTA